MIPHAVPISLGNAESKNALWIQYLPNTKSDRIWKRTTPIGGLKCLNMSFKCGGEQREEVAQTVIGTVLVLGIKTKHERGPQSGS